MNAIVHEHATTPKQMARGRYMVGSLNRPRTLRYFRGLKEARASHAKRNADDVFINLFKLVKAP